MVDNVAFTINLFGAHKDIYWYGIIIATGMLLGIWIATYNARRRGYKSEMVLDIALIAVVTAVIGARVHYVLFSWEYYKGGPFIDVFKIWNGGLAIYGGLIGGLIGLFIYSRFSKKRFLALADILIPSLILGQAIGRWGNFVNQEAYGWAIENPSLAFFPLAVFIKAEGGFFMATFFYESMWDFAVFVFLMNYLKKNRQEGNTLFFYLVLYGFGRMIIEGFRMDSQILLNTGIRVNQVISLLILLFGLAMLLFRKNAPIAQAYKVKLFPQKEGKVKKEKPVEEFDASKVSADLKLMDDEARMKRVNSVKETHTKKEDGGDDSDRQQPSE